MDSSVDIVLRWAHIFPVVVLVGGAVGGSLLGQPSVAPLARGAVLGGIVTILGSGLATMMSLMGSVPKGWHMWFGIKTLLALHVFAMLFLMTNPNAPAEKRARWQRSALVGVAIIIFVAAYLRSMRAV